MSDNSELEVEKIQQISQELAELPPSPTVLTKRKVVALLASDIQRARDKGYTLKQIAQHLESHGIDLGYATIRAALPRQNKKRSAKKKARGATVDTGRRRDGAPPAIAGAPPVVPVHPSRPAPVAPERVTVPPGAASVPTGDGYFVPAPDSDDL